MRQRIQRSISLVGIALVTIGLAMGAPKTERAKSEFTVHGRVLKIDKKERTLLISDHKSKTLYLVTVPEWARFKIFFGICESYDSPTLDNVYRNDIVTIRCARTDEDHFARLDDGRQVVRLTAAR
jgi:hypothetical protein